MCRFLTLIIFLSYYEYFIQALAQQIQMKLIVLTYIFLLNASLALMFLEKSIFRVMS